jgi:hypothetical protein
VSSDEAARKIRSALSELPSDSLRFFGEWFGGRRDNIHRIVNVGVAAEEDVLVLYFNEAETLMIWDSDNITATPTAFRVEDASRLVWQWFYYGRLPTPENLQRMEYRNPDGGLRVVTDFVDDLEAKPERVLHVDEETPAVEMTSLVAE